VYTKHLSIATALLLSSAAHAQHTITRAFAPAFTSLVSQDTDGSFNLLTIDAPDFQSFAGLDYDRTRQRVVFIAKETSSARLVTVDASLDPASLLTIREGIDINAQEVYVDPDSGRIYWWENDEIISVNHDGTGTPIVEADNVPEPENMDIDTDRGFYAVISSDDLMIGNLDGVSSAPPTLIPHQMSGGVQLGLAIEPRSGDIYWTELDEAGGFTGTASAVYRVPHNTPLATPERLLGSEVHLLGLVQIFFDVAVVGDQLAAGSSRGLGQDPLLTILNTTTNRITHEIESLAIDGLAIAYDVDPILNHPVNAIANQGTTQSFEVNPSDELSTYQWSRNGSPLIDDGRISGSTENKLIINNAMLSDSDTYTCTVTTSLGESQTSNHAIFAVRGSTEPVCEADWTNDGELDFFDVSAFLQALLAGCP